MRIITISYTSSNDDVKIQDISGVPREARLLCMTCADSLDSDLDVHIGLVATQVYVLRAGAAASAQFVEFANGYGHPVRWGSGNDDQLFITGGSTVKQGSLTFVTEELGT